jgi:hypothetical protein
MTKERYCSLYNVNSLNLCNEQSNCILIETLTGQAKVGGTNEDGTPAGPIWDAKAWKDLCNRTKEVAEQGCGNIEDLENQIKKLTLDKEKEGHFRR